LHACAPALLQKITRLVVLFDLRITVRFQTSWLCYVQLSGEHARPSKQRCKACPDYKECSASRPNFSFVVRLDCNNNCRQVDPLYISLLVSSKEKVPLSAAKGILLRSHTDSPIATSSAVSQATSSLTTKVQRVKQIRASISVDETSNTGYLSTFVAGSRRFYVFSVFCQITDR
jgi:hypothetical protein